MCKNIHCSVLFCPRQVVSQIPVYLLQFTKIETLRDEREIMGKNHKKLWLE